MLEQDVVAAQAATCIFFIDVTNSAIVEQLHTRVARADIAHLHSLCPTVGQSGSRGVVGISCQFFEVDTHFLATGGERDTLQCHKELLIVAHAACWNDEDFAVHIVHRIIHRRCVGLEVPVAFTFGDVGISEEAETTRIRATITNAHQNATIGKFFHLRLIGTRTRQLCFATQEFPCRTKVVGVNHKGGVLSRIIGGISNIKAVVIALLDIAALHNLSTGEEERVGHTACAVLGQIIDLIGQRVRRPSLSAVRTAKTYNVLRLIVLSVKERGMSAHAHNEHVLRVIAIHNDGGIAETVVPFL